MLTGERGAHKVRVDSGATTRHWLKLEASETVSQYPDSIVNSHGVMDITNPPLCSRANGADGMGDFAYRPLAGQRCQAVSRISTLGVCELLGPLQRVTCTTAG